jgi:fructosamine-3-kinase
VFGGLPDRMWRAYAEVWPLDEGWQERRPALQLYHLLVHVRLFGGSYVAMVAERLDRLGW